ncbi:SGNH/GDSL hydrolase family protein [uncultured Friedmanniella sp.]|uniref:SGNH/GDSL hydrolase family protein n=1 Tax=uncultured Friedmanniella sp. TaxID=335381 RepID=UPI0035CB0ABE
MRWPATACASVLGLLLVLTSCTGTTSSATPNPAPLATTPSASPRRTLNVVALGDSVTAGTNCDCTAFPQLYGLELGERDGADVEVTDEGAGGATSADLLSELPDLSKELGKADIVLITIGANDFSDLSDDLLGSSCGGEDHLACTRTAQADLRRNLTAIEARILAIRDGQPTTILVTGYWNVYEDGDVADHDYNEDGEAASIALTLVANTIIKGTTGESGIRYVDLYSPFKGHSGTHDPTPLLADDGDHPNAAGHKVIARALLAATPG